MLQSEHTYYTLDATTGEVLGTNEGRGPQHTDPPDPEVGRTIRLERDLPPEKRHPQQLCQVLRVAPVGLGVRRFIASRLGLKLPGCPSAVGDARRAAWHDRLSEAADGGP